MRSNFGLALAAAVALTLGACAGGGDGNAPSTAVQSAPQPTGPLPESVSLAQDLKMVPIARDRRGCVLYRMQSERRPNLDALFYRTQAGDFSTIEEEAACT